MPTDIQGYQPRLAGELESDLPARSFSYPSNSRGNQAS